jgi:hypothetical protein
MALAFQSCRKYNDVNTDTVIVTPYSLYFSDSSGSLINTNDGNVFKPSVFPSDGYPSRSICIAGTNILWVKGNAHISTNNGVNFNPTYLNVSSAAFDHSLMLYSADEDRVYLSTNNGIAYSDQKGQIGTWQNDANFATVAGIGVRPTSFTELSDNTIVALDPTDGSIYTKPSKTGAWVAVKVSAPNKPLPIKTKFFLGHYNNTIVAVDSAGKNGVWYSNNKGAGWQQYTGIPTTRALLSVGSPFDGVLLVGTDSLGMYAVQGSSTNFVYSGNGLGISSSIRGITFKENIYENGVAKQYVYISTNQGIYRSQDLGQNWVQVVAGNYYNIW